MYNPYFPYNPNGYSFQQTQQPQQPNNGMSWVQGEVGASAYIVQPGQVMFLFDSTRPVFYIKSCDQYGKPQPLETYDYSKHVDTPTVGQLDMSNYVTKDEMKKYINDLFNGEEDSKNG